MKLRLTTAAAIALLAVQSWAAAGSTIYRCGSSYQAAPCTGGTAVATDDAPSASQVAAAQDVATRDRQLADALTREREQREASATPSQAIAIGPAQQPRDTRPAKPAKTKSRKARVAEKDGVFVAMVPASPKKKRPPKSAS